MARTGRGRTTVGAIAGSLLALGLAAGSATAADQGVLMEDFAFSPGTVTVGVGDSVTWRNNDEAPHDAVADDASWSTELLTDGQTDSVTFDTAGSYPYSCSIHPSMRGTVVVRAAGGGSGGGGGGGDTPPTDAEPMQVQDSLTLLLPVAVVGLVLALVVTAVTALRGRRAG